MKIGYMTNAFGPLVGAGGGVTSVKDIRYVTMTDDEATLEQAWEGKVRKVFSWIVSVYLCVVFGAFPLYFHNYYYDILVSKYQFYWLSTVAMLASCLIAAIVFACMDLKQFDGAHVRRFFGAFRPSELKKQPFVYKALAVFWGLALMSTVLSDYVYESFWGNEGRFSGFFYGTK